MIRMREGVDKADSDFDIDYSILCNLLCIRVPVVSTEYLVLSLVAFITSTTRDGRYRPGTVVSSLSFVPHLRTPSCYLSAAACNISTETLIPV